MTGPRRGLVLLRTMPGSRPRNGIPAPAGYRYGGTLTDTPPAPGRPAPLSGRVLEALADLGGEASTTEIRMALAASGDPPGPRQVPDALNRLARTVPPRVAPVGDGRGGYGKAQRWRLERVRASAGLPARRRCSSCGYYRTGQCKTACGGRP